MLPPASMRFGLLFVLVVRTRSFDFGRKTGFAGPAGSMVCTDAYDEVRLRLELGRGIREVKVLVASWFVAVRLAFEPRLELGGIVSIAGAGAG